MADPHVATLDQDHPLGLSGSGQVLGGGLIIAEAKQRTFHTGASSIRSFKPLIPRDGNGPSRLTESA
jgi:hypothetical protein